MSQTALSAICAAAVASLQAAPPICANVLRTNLRTLPSQTAQAIVVRPMGAAVDLAANAGNPLVWQMQLAVECYARAAPGAAPDVAVDALLDATYTRLMADQTLGLPNNVWLEPLQISYDFAAEADASACATCTFTVRFVTPLATLS